jgi:hypothetical protein
MRATTHRSKIKNSFSDKTTPENSFSEIIELNFRPAPTGDSMLFLFKHAWQGSTVENGNN